MREIYEIPDSNPDWPLETRVFEMILHNDNWQWDYSLHQMNSLRFGSPDSEEYWEAWRRLYNHAVFKRHGHKYTLECDEDDQTMYITPKTEPVLLLSNGWGQYRAQEIYRLISVNKHWGIVLTDETKQSLIDGPECEHHWDSYDLLLQYAVYTDELGLYHRLHDAQGDIWLIPQGFSPEEY